MFETAQDGILLVDFHTGMILDVNKFLLDMLDFSKADFLKRHLWEVGVFKDIAASKKNFRTLQRKRYVRFEDLPLVTKSGKKMDVEFVANAYQVDGETTIQCNIRDITSRVQAQLALQEAEKIAGLGSYNLDITTAKWISSALLDEIFGINEFFKRSIAGWIELIHPDHRQMMSEYFQTHVLGQHHPFDKEYMIIRRSDKSTRWVHGLGRLEFNPQGQPTRMIGTIMDITERKRLEEKILADKFIDEAILESIGDAVFACNSDGHLILFNKMAESVTGITAKEAIGKHYHQVVKFIQESDGTPSDDFIAEAIAKNKITRMTNHTLLVRSDGKKIPVSDSASPIKEPNGKIIGCVCVFHDVTKEYQVDKAKTEFVSLASHQLRTPLSTINWYSEMLLSGDAGQLNPKQEQYAKETHHASKRMCELVNSLLNVSRLELGTFSIDPKQTVVKDLIQTCIKDFRHQIKTKHLSLTQKYSPDVHSMLLDPKLFSIIIQNLLSNAIKYTPSSGKIRLGLTKDTDSILITVSDTGIGIPHEQQDKIFDKLYRADNAKAVDPDGSGLGLYIAYVIASNAGGKIWHKPNTTAGTSFFVRFPITGMKSKTGNKQLT